MANTAELVTHLDEAGIPASARVVDGAIELTAYTDDAAALDAALATFAASAGPEDRWTPLPPSFREHAGHAKALRDAIRAGQTPSNAQVLHVLADVIDYLRLVDPRL